MTPATRVLLIEDNPADARLVSEALRSSAPPPFALDWERTLEGGLRSLGRGSPQVILLDMGLSDSTGLATLDRVRAAAPALPIVLLTGQGDPETPLQAIAQGAQDFLAKRGLDAESLARTLRFALERQRLESEFIRLSAFPRLSPEPLLEVDAGGTPAYVNPAARALFPDLPGLAAAHPLLKGWKEATEPLRRGAAPPLVRAVAVGPRTYEERISPMPGGHAFWVSLSDVTERDLVDRLKREFAQNVCHELNTPLTCLCGSLQTLREDLPRDPRWDVMLGVALRGAQHLADMVGDLADGALADAGRLRVEPRRVDAGRLAVETAAAFACAARAARLSADVPERLPPVLADPVRVRQILNNLIGNARKFTPPGGGIRLRVRIDPDDPSFVRFSVSDDGCGIAHEDAPRVFDRLYQAAPARHGCRGLGIGLFLCRELAAKHGGKIWLESQAGKGSTFSFTLPVYSLACLLAPLASVDRPRTLSVISVTGSAPENLSDPRQRTAALRGAADALRGELSQADVLLPEPGLPDVGMTLLIVSRRRHGSARRLVRRLEAALSKRFSRAPLAGYAWSFSSAALEVGASGTPEDWALAAERALERRLEAWPTGAGAWRAGGGGAILRPQAQP
jgi:signal transduction histidine kinase